MWLVTLVEISTFIAVGIASNFYVDTVNGCDTPIFHRHHGNALLNHVIKTLPLFFADCMTACQETLGCFSINYYKNQGFVCDLNRSTKTQDPGSFVRMSGYEYAEAEKKKYCEKSKCHSKEALPDGWFSLDDSKFKFISDKKSWQDSKQHCQTFGAKLASFESELESRFVHQTMNMTSTVNTPAPSGDNPTTPSGGGGNSGGTTLVAVKMDGTDPSETFSMFNGAAAVDVDGKRAVFFDGMDDYATVPRFDITGDLTIAFWVKAEVASNKYLFSDFDAANNKYMFRIYVSLGKLAFSLQGTTGSAIIGPLKSSSNFPLNVWVHAAITWNRSTKEGKVFLDGNPEGSMTSTANDLNTYNSPNQNFEIGARKQGSSTQFSGYMQELFVIEKALSQAEITALKDNGPSAGPNPAPTPAADGGGPWVGLNDVTTEGTFQWSDGSPLTYYQLQSSDNTEEKDCVLLPNDGDSSSKWIVAECTQENPFLCKKH
ncbi:uncharacterized protein LOC116292015 [Actinia tenebrosa]|uniref:Uncharacterized protein LOC116292015 n=1 Tax=Actinia tenebrosa TaxID=6105 RepID=A0A6P8HJQ0_ACTTE|nr:uncharacterized protein LOC116292015 [Actinia tenebrosa]